MNNYDENKESSFLSHLDANNLYGCPMIKKRPVGSLKWVKNVSRIGEEFINIYDENSDMGYFLRVDLEYPKELHDLHSDLPFLPKKWKLINMTSLYGCYMIKKICCTHKKHKTSIKSWLKTKKIRKAIAFYQEAWLKPYIDMNAELREGAKNNFEKHFCKLMNNAVFGRSIMNVRRHRDIKLATDDKKRCKLESMRSYYTRKQFLENFSSNRNEKDKNKNECANIQMVYNIRS